MPFHPLDPTDTQPCSCSGYDAVAGKRFALSSCGHCNGTGQVPREGTAMVETEPAGGGEWHAWTGPRLTNVHGEEQDAVGPLVCFGPYPSESAALAAAREDSST